MSSEAASPPSLVGGSWAAIWQLSWPLVLTMLLTTVISIVDAWIAGRYGATAQAAVGVVMQLVMLVNAVIIACSIGCQALVARFVGAEDPAEAARAARQSLLLGLWCTLALLIPVFVLAPWLFRAMGAPPDLQAVGSGFLRLLVGGLLQMDLGIVLNAIFRAQGATRAILWASAAEALVGISSSFGLGWFAHWGLVGLAIGFVLGKSSSLLVGWTIFRRSALYRAASGWKSDGSYFRRILHVGAPAGVQVVVRNLAMMAFFGILARVAHPTEAVAAYTLAFRVESMAFNPVFALNIAASTLVGQNLGAGQPDHAARAAWQVVWVAVALMSGFGLVFWFGATPLARIFSPDPLVVHYGADYLWIMGLSEPALGIAMVLTGALQGAGETRPPLILTMLSQIAVRLPLAYLLALPLGWGPEGAWWAMSGSTFIQAGLNAWWFRRGSWREQVV